MDAAGMVEAIVGAEREAARAMARQAEFIAALSRDVVMEPSDSGTDLDRLAMLEAELSTALHVSSRTAGARIEVALALTGRLPGTLAALHAGELDWFRARVIAEETSGPAVAAAQAALDAGRSPTEAERAAVEVSRRIEERVLPRATGQTPGRLRRSLARAVIAVDPGAAERRRREAGAGRRASFVVLPDAMAELCFRMPAVEAVEVWNRLDQHARAARAEGDARSLDQLRVDTLVGMVTGAISGDSAPTRRTKAHVLVTVPADTLLALGDLPGDLDGYGPIPAGLARAVAARDDATWRRILTDPASGALLDYGRTTYTPPAALADHVIARDRTCTFPSCGVTATRCDLDHVVPYPVGETSPDNLHPLCRRHHLLKHRGRWRVTLDPDTGELTWTSPAGQHHHRTPEPVLAA